nr:MULTISPECIES: DUF922 domain-containing protein [unclassified Pseudoalteromonas]
MERPEHNLHSWQQIYDISHNCYLLVVQTHVLDKIAALTSQRQKGTLVRYLIFLLFSFSLHAQLVIDETTQNYAVSAEAPDGLLHALDSASPVKRDNKVVHGYTYYDIRWQFWFDSKSRQCDINKVTTTLELEYTLPQLTDSTESVKKAWSQWFSYLAEHEHEHGRMIKAMAQRIDEQLEAIPELGSCRVIEQQAALIGNALKQELAQQLQAYDEQTNHGRTEKAWLVDHLQATPN